MSENPNQPLVPNEAPPAYSPPAASSGYQPIDGGNKAMPPGAAADYKGMFSTFHTSGPPCDHGVMIRGNYEFPVSYRELILLFN